MKANLIQLFLLTISCVLFYLGYTALDMTFEEAFGLLHIVSGILGFIGAHILLLYMYIKFKKKQ